jgi:hypothetical protein
MKTAKIIWVVSLACVSCSFNKPKIGACNGFVFDISEQTTRKDQLDITNLKYLYEKEGSLNASAIGYLGFISDIRYTGIEEFKIPGATINGNVFDRQNLYNQFYTNIIRQTETIHDSTGTRFSFVAFANAKMLHKIAGCLECSERNVYIFGDLAENTEAFSIYKQEDSLLLIQSPLKVMDYFDKWYPLPDINGVEVTFVYRPSNRRIDAQYDILSRFFKDYYQRHGANVNITATLPKYHGK